MISGTASPEHPYAGTLGRGGAQTPGVPGCGEINGKRTGEPEARAGDKSTPPAEKVKPVLVIVDDEPDVLRSVQHLLRLDYQVVTFQHGADAIELFGNSAAGARDPCRTSGCRE